MKKQQIAAAACLVAGAIGFAAVYSTQKPGKDEIPTEISQTSSIVEPTEKKTPQKTTEKVDSETKMGQEESAAGQQENQQPAIYRSVWTYTDHRAGYARPRCGPVDRP